MTDTITESELTLLAKGGGVARLLVRQTEQGKYRVFACVNYQAAPLALTTFRKGVREWASLDRLVKHAQEVYVSVPEITVQLWR